MKAVLFKILILCAFVSANAQNLPQDTLVPDREKDFVEFRYNLDVFEEIFEPRHLYTLEYVSKNKWGTLVPRISHVDRFDKQDYAIELDAYPRINKTTYLYARYGYGIEGTLFPKHRFSIEAFKTFAKKYEASIGYKFMNFPHTDISVLTASLGYYYKSYWFNFRTYLTPRDSEVANAYTLVSRKYFKDDFQHLQLQIGYGSSFEDVDLLEATQINTFRLGFGGLFKLFPKYYLNLNTEYRNEELVFNTDKTVNRLSIMLGIRKLF